MSQETALSQKTAMNQASGDAGEAPVDEAFDAAASLEEIAWRLRQCWADAVNILALESRTALHSLFLLAVLIFCLAGVLAGAWLVLMLMLIYGATALGIPVWGIIIAVLVLHLLVFAGLAQQLLALARLLSFPRSRQAAAELLNPPRTEPDG